jgi:hypothetical protein
MATVEELAGRQFSRILAMRDESIEIRRGTDTLNPQTVRLERAEARALTLDNQTSEQVVADVVILGSVDLDIATGDRFNDSSGNLIEVVAVNPNRQVATVAQGRIVS